MIRAYIHRHLHISELVLVWAIFCSLGNTDHRATPFHTGRGHIPPTALVCCYQHTKAIAGGPI